MIMLKNMKQVISFALFAFYLVYHYHYRLNDLIQLKMCLVIFCDHY
uniref:Uncharacterized protein n=1 Tax=Schistosoma curassoni TaxID=6186 RepID=A0A183L4B3_9TREM